MKGGDGLMPQQPVADRVRHEVRALGMEVDPTTAETVALAMVAGAARGYLDITRAGHREAAQHLLRALALDPEAVLGAITT